MLHSHAVGERVRTELAVVQLGTPVGTWQWRRLVAWGKTVVVLKALLKFFLLGS